jgi:uncharacterized integral membrane protein (TIGR00698 family)
VTKWGPRAVVLGLVWTSAVALPAWGLSHVVPLLGAPVIAILTGIAVTFVHRPPPSVRLGIAFWSTVLLQLAIVLLGATLSLGKIVHVGARSLPVMLGTLAVALVGAATLGRALRVQPRLRTLVGVGTGICGASAIAAVSRIVEATQAEIAYAISTVFVFNVVAVICFPPLGRLIGMGQHGFGLWAGTAVNDTSSVVAVAYAFGHAAGAQAVVVKLARTTLIIPIALGLAAARARRPRAGRLVPPFLPLFVLASVIDTAGLVGPDGRRVLADVALGLITVALAGVGLGADAAGMRRTGLRPLALGAVLWILVASASVGLQALTGQL